MTNPRPEPDRRFASKITAEQAAQVRADRAAGVSISEIARRLWVGRPSIRSILAGRTHRVKIPDAELDRVFDEMNSQLRAELDAAEEAAGAREPAP